MTNTIEFRFKQEGKNAIIQTTILKDLSTYEELIDKLDINYVNFTEEIKNNINEGIPAKG